MAKLLKEKVLPFRRACLKQDLLESGEVITVAGGRIRLSPQTLCVHSDTPAAVATPVVDGSVPRIPTAQPASALAAGPNYGQRVAASFMDGRITNPLFRARTAHESSRH